MLQKTRNWIRHRSKNAAKSTENSKFEESSIYSDDLDLEFEKLEAPDTKNTDVEKEQAVLDISGDDSPYSEVRAAVRNYDEDIPCNTIRAWAIGLFLVTIVSAFNTIFSMRAPPIVIGPFVALVLAYPMGRGWDLIMPKRTFKTFGHEWSLVPGPFNRKEHVIVVAMVNVGGGTAYSTDILLAQITRYKFDFGWGFAILLTLSAQCLGFGLAGLCRRFLVWPAAMIWPGNLVSTTLLYTLHDRSKVVEANGWSISRQRFFLYVLIGSFCWYWIPGWLFKALSIFAFPTFLAPNSVIVNQLFGGRNGLSLIPITLDWAQVASYLGSPLIPPVQTIANVLFGTFIFGIVTTAAVHYGSNNAWYSAYVPITGYETLDNTGKQYNISRILDEHHRLDVSKYESYSPLFLSTTFVLGYGLAFAAITATIVHVVLYHGKDTWERMKQARNQEDDIHMKLMKKYKDSPEWWYVVLFLIMLAMAFASVLAYDTGLKWWAFIISIILAAAYLIPVGIIQATTGIPISLNVISELIIGYMLPGRPTATMIFKTFSTLTVSRANSFTEDLKLGHYMKIPPRPMFWAQVTAAVWTSILQVVVMYWALGAIEGLCTKDAVNQFTCPNASMFFNASIIWGAIGPERIFGSGRIYSGLMWFFLIGATVPIIFYCLHRRFPKSFFHRVCWPIIFTGLSLPATPLNYFAWGIVGFVFNYHIRKRFFGWWANYNYLLSAGLDVGLALCTFIIFLTLSFTHTKAPNWWGNNVVETTMDFRGTAIQKSVGDFGRFGPSEWH
ncbi:hypothetical protein H072_6564 [Dactylellina haptotyla CBS 200.50]|uniref:OPT family small oligopeptide transporter n=1 Tax=Dactylellina haptotyla (strain CBS 200.50) TaxID=1284197 RepID=S8BWD9_DACHA|nr:hypothetical protein H072_6564 [Dactylellina haptotyla CBS 200.50]